MAKKAVKKATTKPVTPAAPAVPAVCMCPQLAEPHYHLPEGAIVVWEPVKKPE